MFKINILALLILCMSVSVPTVAQEVANPKVPPILSMRARAEIRDAWLEERLNTVVPMVMRRSGVDMWVLIAREYNEDPVVETMLPATWLSARRRTILVFHDNGETVERFAVARYPVGEAFPSAWDPEAQPDQWAALADMIAERDPAKIALNISPVFAIADGATHSQVLGFTEALPEKYQDRLTDGEDLSIGWLETRIPAEMARYGEIMRVAHAIIGEAFSRAVITPGKTTTNDVVWWMRQRVNDLGLKVWFHPSVSIQRADKVEDPLWPARKKEDQTIYPGDFLHTDFGITYLGLNTDTQHHAYVLRGGETEAPEGLRAGLSDANKVQDHLTNAYKTGRTSNAILAAARAGALGDGLRPTIYTHPIGFHGHAAGSPIGWWDDQSTDHPQGFRPLQANTAWSIELNAMKAVPEWGGQDVVFKTEEDAFFDGERVTYIDGRQIEITLIPGAD